MKQISIFTCVLLLMASCSVKSYYQVVDVRSTNVPKENNSYVYNDGICKIEYNFWKNGGNAGFTVTNLSEKVIYLDLANTFLVKNGQAKDYYKARNYGHGKNFQVTKGSSVGKSKSATAYGELVGGYYNGYPGSVSGQMSLQMSSYFSEGSSYSITYSEKAIIPIPPHAFKILSEYNIIEDAIQDCSVRLKVKKNKPEGITFTESESPLKFSNYITYRTEENGEAKAITNDFYIGGFTNYLSTDILQSIQHGCKKTITMQTCDKYAADRYYIMYNQKHSRDYSADASNLNTYN